MTVPSQVAHVDTPTEQRHPHTSGVDRLSTVELLRLINSEDVRVPFAVAPVLPQLARAVDRAVLALAGGFRVHYLGAGTSGRLAAMDAAELGPTYDVPDDWFVVHTAGGERALRQAVEGAEDDMAAGASSVAGSVRRGDVVVGLSASGRTPFVLGGLAAAHRAGATTVLVCSTSDTVRGVDVDILIATETGPEVIAGSTRMKAGSAQKLVLTSFSTAVMVRLGRTYSNLMVNMRQSNAKLRGRAVRILREATGLGLTDCSDALALADGDLKVALVHLLSGADPVLAAKALHGADGRVRDALDLLAVAI